MSRLENSGHTSDSTHVSDAGAGKVSAANVFEGGNLKQDNATQMAQNDKTMQSNGFASSDTLLAGFGGKGASKGNLDSNPSMSDSSKEAQPQSAERHATGSKDGRGVEAQPTPAAPESTAKPQQSEQKDGAADSKQPTRYLPEGTITRLDSDGKPANGHARPKESSSSGAGVVGNLKAGIQHYFEGIVSNRTGRF